MPVRKVESTRSNGPYFSGQGSGEPAELAEYATDEYFGPDASIKNQNFEPKLPSTAADRYKGKSAPAGINLNTGAPS